MRSEYEEANANSLQQRSRNAVTVKIVAIENGFLVTRGNQGPPVYCEHISGENTNHPTVVTLLKEFYEEINVGAR